MYNGGKQLFAKQGNMQLGEGREAMLQYIYEIHKIKHSAIIAIALGGGIPTAVTREGGRGRRPSYMAARGVTPFPTGAIGEVLSPRGCSHEESPAW